MKDLCISIHREETTDDYKGHRWYGIWNPSRIPLVDICDSVVELRSEAVLISRIPPPHRRWLKIVFGDVQFGVRQRFGLRIPYRAGRSENYGSTQPSAE
jgi:hypothetical protein